MRPFPNKNDWVSTSSHNCIFEKRLIYDGRMVSSNHVGKVADWTAPSSDASKDSTAPTTSFRRKRQDEQAALQASLPPTLFNYQHQEVEDSSFSVVDRQTATLKKSAVRSVRPSGSFSRASVTSNTSGGGGGASARNSTVSQSGRYSSTKRPTRFGQQNVRVRDASIKVQAGWKLIEELDFNRMTNLYFEAGDAEDLYVFFCELIDKEVDLVFGSDDKYPCTLILMMHCILFTLSDPYFKYLLFLLHTCHRLCLQLLLTLVPLLVRLDPFAAI